MEFKIRDIVIENPVVVAPMAGISNAAFRTIVKEFGAGLVVCEMISDMALIHRNQKTLDMLYIAPNEYPLSVQIMGGNKDSLVEAAKYVAENTDAAIIDINMGCPVNKVIKNEAGASWLKDPDKVYEMVEAVVEAVEKPVTVKIRTGWDENSILAVENALAAESAGAEMIALHGRTREQMYTGKADWEIIKDVASAVKSIPVVGNGDIRTPEQARQRYDESGVAGVMIGRGALGNPWLIKQTVHYFETGELLPPVTPRDKMQMAVEHLERIVKLEGDSKGTKQFRTLAHYYLKGMPRSTKVKEEVNHLETSAEVSELLLKFGEESMKHYKEPRK